MVWRCFYLLLGAVVHWFVPAIPLQPAHTVDGVDHNAGLAFSRNRVSLVGGGVPVSALPPSLCSAGATQSKLKFMRGLFDKICSNCKLRKFEHAK